MELVDCVWPKKRPALKSPQCDDCVVWLSGETKTRKMFLLLPRRAIKPFHLFVQLNFLFKVLLWMKPYLRQNHHQCLDWTEKRRNKNSVRQLEAGTIHYWMLCNHEMTESQSISARNYWTGTLVSRGSASKTASQVPRLYFTQLFLHYFLFIYFSCNSAAFLSKPDSQLSLKR